MANSGADAVDWSQYGFTRTQSGMHLAKTDIFMPNASRIDIKDDGGH